MFVVGPKKQINLKINEQFLDKFDSMRSLTEHSDRTEMIIQAMWLYMLFIEQRKMKPSQDDYYNDQYEELLK